MLLDSAKDKHVQIDLNKNNTKIDFNNPNRITQDFASIPIDNLSNIKNIQITEDTLSGNSSNNSFDNITDILSKSDSLREKLMKQILDIYKTNPEKLYNDLGPSDFSKVRKFINL